MTIVQIIGNLGSDPETKMLPSGQRIITFSIATSYKKKGEETSTWWSVTLWDKKFDPMLPHIKKGTLLLVVGDLAPPKTYVDKNGQTKINLSISADIIRFLPGKKKEEDGEHKSPEKAQGSFIPGNGISLDDEELPF